MSTRLIVSIAGITEERLSAARGMWGMLADRGVPVSWFVVPRHASGHGLTPGGDVARWLRARRANGDAIVLHGYDEAATKRRRSEFAELSPAAARLRLAAADRMLEQAEIRTRLFAAPRWRLSPGALDVLPECGFRLSIALDGVRDLSSHAVEPSLVVGVGGGLLSGSRQAESWACRALVLAAARTARRGETLRIAVGAKQLRREPLGYAVVEAVDLALKHGLQACTYEQIDFGKGCGAA